MTPVVSSAQIFAPLIFSCEAGNQKQEMAKPLWSVCWGDKRVEYIKEDFEPSRAIENKSAHGELVEPLERLERARLVYIRHEQEEDGG